MNTKEIYDILKYGSPEERIRFIKSAPENSFKTSALPLIGSENKGLVVVAAVSLVSEYCTGRNPIFGVVFSEATHSLALEIFKERTDQGGLLPTTLSNLASQHVNALNLLGRSEEVLQFAEKYIPFYETLNEKENLPTLYCAKANALLNLNQVDEAEAVLKNIDSSRNPGAKIEINRLLKKITVIKGKITDVEQPSLPQQNSNLADLIKDAFGNLGKDGKKIQEFIEKKIDSEKIKQLDPNDNVHFKKTLDILNKGEAFLTKNSDAENEWTMKRRWREATKIFKLESRPASQKIKLSLQNLSEILEWANKNQHTELANDALWGMYLCYSRQDNDTKAADKLISLRTNLEKQRAGIADPFERGGVFSVYPNLFNALCEKLQRSNRYLELLVTMEASKGRGIADILTRQYGKAVADTDIYSAANKLPLLAKKFKFHYLSYYLDRYNGETITHQVVVGKNGKVYGTDPVVLPNDVMDSALTNLDPQNWGHPRENDPSTLIPDSSSQLSPLTDFLNQLMKECVIEKGDHICYTADENLNNLPLHYLPFCKKMLIDFFSFSKIHNALQLELILKSASTTPGKATAFIVPTLQNTKSNKWQKIHSSLSASIQCLKSIIPTEIHENEMVSIEKLKQADLCNRVLHFSTHGVFPRESSGNNPITNSGIVISDGNSLPDANEIARGKISHLLSPEKIISNKIKIKGSHVTLMACVSGLSHEGLGGDALGMDWALAQAGATSILASHWMVSAADAATFFKLFYIKWLQENKSRGQAFRETIDELRSKHGTTANAHCWAAFSLSGDWR